MRQIKERLRHFLKLHVAHLVHHQSEDDRNRKATYHLQNGDVEGVVESLHERRLIEKLDELVKAYPCAVPHVVGVEVHKGNHIAEDRDIAEDEHEKHAGKNQKIQPLVADNIFFKALPAAQLIRRLCRFSCCCHTV